MKQETKCLHSGYVPKNGEPRQMPIYQSTTFKYDSSDAMGRLFDLEDSGYFYTRLQNPSNDMTAAKLPTLRAVLPQCSHQAVRRLTSLHFLTSAKQAVTLLHRLQSTAVHIICLVLQ